MDNIDYKVIDYFTDLKNVLINSGKFKTILIGFKFFLIFINTVAYTGWLLPPDYKFLTILYIIIILFLIFNYYILKTSALSNILNNFTDENDKQIINIPQNRILFIWFIFCMISINGYFNNKYSAFNVLNKLFFETIN